MSTFKPVILWTDALVFLLVASVIVLTILTLREAQSRGQWRKVFSTRLGMASSVVLLFFALVGLLDCMHFRQALAPTHANSDTHYSAEVLSVLDVVMGPVRTQVEKSYSAPFAYQLFSQETRVTDDGQTRRIYPRLQYGAAHLVDPERGRAADVFRRLVAAVGVSLMVTALVATLFVVMRGRARARRKKGNDGRTGINLPWRTALLVFWVIALCVAAAVELSPYYHIMGTDKVGNDVFYQSVKSIRTGLLIGTLTTLIMLPFAVLLGILAGYRRGWIDDTIQYLYTTLNSIPGVLLIAAAILMLQVYVANHPESFQTTADRADMRLLFLCIILGITSWTGLCRLLRGEALKLRESDFVQAAGAFGVSHFKIIMKHILPNVMHIVLISVVLDFSGLVLAEAVLSYVGVGVDPTMTSWGNMINRARLEMAREPVVWWSLMAAFVFMFALVLSANLFSDAVRDAFDPRLNRR